MSSIGIKTYERVRRLVKYDESHDLEDREYSREVDPTACPKSSLLNSLEILVSPVSEGRFDTPLHHRPAEGAIKKTV
jgi:hypothetical protein